MLIIIILLKPNGKCVCFNSLECSDWNRVVEIIKLYTVSENEGCFIHMNVEFQLTFLVRTVLYFQYRLCYYRCDWCSIYWKDNFVGWEQFPCTIKVFSSHNKVVVVIKLQKKAINCYWNYHSISLPIIVTYHVKLQ